MRTRKFRYANGNSIVRFLTANLRQRLTHPPPQPLSKAFIRSLSAKRPFDKNVAPNWSLKVKCQAILRAISSPALWLACLLRKRVFVHLAGVSSIYLLRTHFLRSLLTCVPSPMLTVTLLALVFDFSYPLLFFFLTFLFQTMTFIKFRKIRPERGKKHDRRQETIYMTSGQRAVLFCVFPFRSIFTYQPVAETYYQLHLGLR